MNERIIELAKRALEETQLMMIMEYKNFESKLYEKFAELIVKETMQVVANNLPQNTYLDVADAVIEHFKE